MTTPSGPHPEEQPDRSAQRTAGETDGKPLPLQLELPRGPRSEALERAADHGLARPPLGGVRALAISFGVVVLLGVLAGAAALWLLPWYVRRECIEAAALHGIDLSVDAAKIDADGFHLVGVRATSPVVRGARARAPAVDVQTSALRPQRVTVRGAELTLAGPWSEIDADLARWRASPGGGQGGAWAPVSVVIDGARVVWPAPIGENVRVEASAVHADVVWDDRGTELHARSDHLTAALARGTVGPWRVDLDRTSTASRVRVALDPGVPEACTVLLVGDGDQTTAVDVVVPRTPLVHLGVSPELLGISGHNLQVEATMHYVALGPTRADANAKGGMYGISAPGLPNPLDVSWEGTASGDASAGIDVKKARLAVGPLVGALTGTLKKFAEGFRVNLAWAAGPVPCAGFVAVLGLGQPFDVGYELRKLAAGKIKGSASASLMVSFDSRDLGATKVDFAPELSCSGSFF